MNKVIKTVKTYNRNVRDIKNNAMSSQPQPVKVYDKNGKLVKTITNFEEIKPC